MTKHEFQKQLKKRLSGLSAAEREERLTFYLEMIDDRMEEGFSEEDAVRAAGSLDEIALQSGAASDKTKQPQKRSIWGMVLLILGSPLWLVLLIAGFCVLLSLYITVWSVIVSLWAVFVSLLIGTFGVAVIGVGFAVGTNPLVGLALIGGGMIFAGLAIFSYFGCRKLTGGVLWLTKRAARCIRHGGKEEAL